MLIELMQEMQPGRRACGVRETTAQSEI